MSELPATARVATITDFGRPLEVRSVPVPAPIEPGAIVVRVDCATVCGTDVHLWNGALDPNLPLTDGYVPGHECVGSIAAFGDGPRLDSLGAPLDVGDRIVWTGESCGRCHECSVLHEPGLCRERRGPMTMPSTRFPYLTGAFAEYAYVLPRAQRLRVPDAIKAEWASAASCALRTVMHAFERLGRISPAESVVVQGAGPLGLFAVAVAKHAGARRVIVIGGPPSRLSIAEKWGADHVVDLSDTPSARADVVRELTDGGPDVIVEATGVAAAFGEGVMFARPGARYVLTGAVDTAESTVVPGLITRKQLTVLGTWSASIAHYQQALDFLATVRDEVDLDLLFTSHHTLEGVTDALAGMAAAEQVKPVVWPFGPPPPTTQGGRG